MLLLARLVRMLTAAVVVVIVAGIVLHVLDANAGNAVVSLVHDVAGWLVTPFRGIFDVAGRDAQIALNWGLAALVYAVVGGVVAALLARAALGAHERGGLGRRRGVAY